MMKEVKEEVKTLLEQSRLHEVQEGLNLAEEPYIKGEFAKSLWNARKALEDLFQLWRLGWGWIAKIFSPDL
jgi:hypothetical protein